MKGLTVFETEAVLELLNQLKAMNQRIEEMYSSLNDMKKPFMSTPEVAEFIGFGEKWVQDNKEKLGFKNIGGNLRFKRKDVIAFMEQDFYKAKRIR